MGMFDTIILPTPIICDNCGVKITNYQTKKFGNCLEVYEVGDCIFENVVTGIVNEKLFCVDCLKILKNPDVYIIVKRHVLIGIGRDYETAEKLLQGFSGWDIYDFYHKLYEWRCELERGFSRLTTLLKQYQEYICLSDDEVRKIKNDNSLLDWKFSSIKDCLDKKNPVECIVHKVEEKLSRKVTKFGFV
ncbi:MAG: hypothetical protein ACTSRG_04375 [Candidatus Helarchaeota archaeon]